MKKVFSLILVVLLRGCLSTPKPK